VRAALDAVLAPRGVMRMADSPLRALEGLPLERGVWWGDVPERVEVELEGFRVEADLHHGQKTGLFLDQRMNRRRAEAHGRDRRVLDLFCYQGEWGLHAARGGARAVLAVDSSEAALAAAARNFERNGLAERVTLRRGDCVRRRAPARARGRALRARRARPARAREIAPPPRRRGEGLPRSQPRRHGDAGGGRRARHQLVQPPPRRRAVPPGAAGVRARRAPSVPHPRVGGESPDHPQLLAVPETHYLKCAVLQAI
jgi:23S rRNA (cytosine1962-C5)-methyltransferase